LVAISFDRVKRNNFSGSKMFILFERLPVVMAAETVVAAVDVCCDVEFDGAQQQSEVSIAHS
jgi:hypothetical protein